MQPISLYLHIPFCTHRCAYCDFNTYAGLEDLIPPYVKALITELQGLARAGRQRLPVHTIFFGGGTPSLLPAEEIARILVAIRTHYQLAPYMEITLEANPGTLSLDYLQKIREAGVQRLSLGVQSSRPEELRLLERQHSFGEVIESVKWARQAGFENINLDLIFALPGQSLQSWQHNLELALSLNPEHLALYALSIEHGTPFQHMLARGLLTSPDPDLAAQMYESAIARLDRAGFEHYEISNWARRDAAGQLLSCIHNLQYWRNQPYLGLGAGAHGWVEGYRTVNVLSPAAYIQRLESSAAFEFPRTPATSSAVRVGVQRAMAERMLMGLRLLGEGVSRNEFASRFGMPLEAVYGPAIARLESLNLIEVAGSKRERVRLTPRGMLLGNQVFMEFV